MKTGGGGGGVLRNIEQEEVHAALGVSLDPQEHYGRKDNIELQ